MLLVTRALVAAAVIVGTVVLSLGASFGVSVLVWQHLVGLPLHFTMMSMAVSDLAVVAQVGSTIGLGLLFDTLIIRAFMTPAIAALMGKWFWWPQVVRQRPVSTGAQRVR